MNGASFHISILTLLGFVAIAGFYMGRMARIGRMPSLLGYMILGIILGPSLLNLFNEQILNHLPFLAHISLGFVAFIIGSELSLSSLKKFGYRLVIIIFSECFGAFFLVFMAVYLLTRDLPLSLILGAIAPASAPAGTVAVIQEYRARGTLTKALYAVVGFDDGLAIIIFGLAFSLAKNLLMGEAFMVGKIHQALYMPLSEIGLSLLMGAIMGYAYCLMVSKIQKSSDILILAFGIVLFASGLSIRWHLSLILTNMMAGFMVANLRHGALTDRVRRPVLEIMPLIYILFFCLAGANLRLSHVSALGVLGLVYIFSRSAGKIGGAWLGGALGKAEEKIRKNLGFGILSQAGVAIGLALIVKDELTRLAAQFSIPHALEIGGNILTTITVTCIFFEIVGPILTKYALKRAFEIEVDRGE